MAKVSEAHLAARRRSIVVAACSVFSKKGYQATTMAEIAREAGISPGAIYRYFPSKDELALGCFSEGMEAVGRQWMEPAGPEGSALAAFETLARATFGLLAEPAGKDHTILALEQILSVVRAGDEAGLAALERERETIAQAVAARLAQAHDAREIAPDLNPDILARALLGFYWGARIARLIKPEADTDAQFEQVMLLLARSAPARR